MLVLQTNYFTFEGYILDPIKGTEWYFSSLLIATRLSRDTSCCRTRLNQLFSITFRIVDILNKDQGCKSSSGRRSQSPFCKTSIVFH